MAFDVVGPGGYETSEPIEHLGDLDLPLDAETIETAVQLYDPRGGAYADVRDALRAAAALTGR